jgi:hypothetical protein
MSADLPHELSVELAENPIGIATVRQQIASTAATAAYHIRLKFRRLP